MLRQDILPVEFAFSTVLKACSALGEFEMGRQIHGLIVKRGIEVVVSVGTPLVEFYAKCKMIESARQAFDRLDILELEIMTWQWKVHADAIKRGLISYHCAVSAKITMYSKCGLLDYAFRAFQDIDEPDAIAWTSMISGCASHGNASKALKLCERMQNSGVNPNAVTFTSVFAAFCHSGLVTDTMKFLGYMPVLYGVEPTIHHYGCVIDVYTRAGKLQEAYELINTMPFEPDAISWKG